MTTDDRAEYESGTPRSVGTEEHATPDEMATWDENCDSPHPVFEVEHQPARTSPFVKPPEGPAEWWWTVEAQTSTMDIVAKWPASGKHRAGAKQEFLDGLGDEIEVVEWGETYARR